MEQFCRILAGPPALDLEAIQILINEFSSVDEAVRIRRNFKDLESICASWEQKFTLVKGAEEEARQMLATLEKEKQLLETDVSSLTTSILALKQEVAFLRTPSPPIFASALPRNSQGQVMVEDTIDIVLISAYSDAKIYYTIDSSEPSPDNFAGSGGTMLAISVCQPAIINAVALNDNGKSDVCSLEFVLCQSENQQERCMPNNEDRLGQLMLSSATAAATGGIGMLITRYHEDGVIEVRNLIEGGAAARDGRIRPGDRILAVDQQETRSLGKAEVLQLIAGPTGSVVELKLMRGSAVFIVTLVRTAAGYNPEGKAPTVHCVQSRLAGMSTEPNLAFILGPPPRNLVMSSPSQHV